MISNAESEFNIESFLKTFLKPSVLLYETREDLSVQHCWFGKHSEDFLKNIYISQIGKVVFEPIRYKGRNSNFPE